MIMGSLCVFGASSAWGAGDVEKGGWVNRLRLWIDEKNRKGDDFYLETYNLGVSGDQTSDLLERFKVESAARHPEIIIFSIGDNDSAGRKNATDYRTSPDMFVSNLERLIQQAKKHTQQIIFLGLKPVNETMTNPVSWHSEAYYTNVGIRKYDELLHEVAKKHHVHYLSLDGVLNNDDLGDGLHPNSSGHEKIFRHVRRYLEKQGFC